MKTKFAENMRKIRLRNGWSLEEMAKVLGTNKQTLSRYERGERTPQITVAAKYANILHIPLEELVGEPKIKKVRVSVRGPRSTIQRAVVDGITVQKKAVYPAVGRIQKSNIPVVGITTIEDRELLRLWKIANPKFKSSIMDMLRTAEEVTATK